MSIDDVENAIQQRIEELNNEIRPLLGKLRPVGVVENKTCKLMGLEEALLIIKKLKGE